MRRWEDSTFVFISTNPHQRAEGVEQRWLEVMKALAENGASVRFLCLMGSPMGEWARELGIAVDPYILDKWNVIRSRSRLRKYLRRYVPVCAHSTGVEADLLLRWAARKVPEVRVVHTLTAEQQSTRRRRPVDAFMRRFDEWGMRSADAVFVETESLAEEARAAGVDPSRVLMDHVDPARPRDMLRQYLELYRRFMATRGTEL